MDFIFHQSPCGKHLYDNRQKVRPTLKGGWGRSAGSWVLLVKQYADGNKATVAHKKLGGGESQPKKSKNSLMWVTLFVSASNLGAKE